MTANSSNFTGDVPGHYDHGLGPNIFEDYARLLAASCNAVNPDAVLELAAGTGIVSRLLRDVVKTGTHLTVTDLNLPMLDVAQRKFSPEENVSFQEADAMSLPFGDAQFDLITCQFGVMFFPDKPASFREAARVLRSGGHYIFNVWGSLAENPFAQMTQSVCDRVFPDNPPGFYKVPFHYSDPETVISDLNSAGWKNVTHETIGLRKTIADPAAFARALVYGNPLADEIRNIGGIAPDDVVRELLDGLHSTFGPSLEMPLSATTYICRAP